MTKKEIFYTKLQAQIDETTSFPSDYLFKFIVLSDKNQAKEVEDLFYLKGAVITKKKSKKGKYVSVSVVINAESSKEIISYYREAEKIKGIISL